MAEPGREMLTRGTGMCETLALAVCGLGNIKLRVLGVRVWEGVEGILGGVDITEPVGDSARCIREVGTVSSSSLSDIRLDDLNWSAGTGILLGVRGRGRGLIVPGIPNDVAREDGRLTLGGLTCVLGVDIVEFDGDHGRDDACELGVTLLRPNTLAGDENACPTDGRLGGVALMVKSASGSTFVELFQRCFFGSSCREPLDAPFELSETLCVALWPLRKKTDARSRNVGTGSLDGNRGVLGVGVERPGPVIRAANLRNGEMDRERVEVLDGARLRGGEGVSRKPLPDFVVPRDTVDSVSVRSELRLRSIRRTLSISVSIRLMRSRRFRHRPRISACKRKHSPFFVTLSRTPLSTTDRILVTDGI